MYRGFTPPAKVNHVHFIRLEIIICKHEEGQMWRYLVENDDRGQELVDNELVKEVHERLAHLCSETEVRTK